ncbi:hypothetical protein AgCh_017310 [Apium graveolens]
MVKLKGFVCDLTKRGGFERVQSWGKKREDVLRPKLNFGEEEGRERCRLIRRCNGGVLGAVKPKRDVFLSNTLINLYVKLGDLGCARLVFDEMSDRNMVSWACLVSGYVQNEFSEEALVVFRGMIREGFVSNSYAIRSVLRQCYKLGSRGVGLGLQVHGIQCPGITAQSSSEHLMLKDAAVRSGSCQEDLYPSQLKDAGVSTSGENTSCANDETSMNDSLMMVVCAQRAPGHMGGNRNKLDLSGLTTCQGPEAANFEAENSGVQDGEHHFSKHEYAIGRGKYSGIWEATSKNGNIEHGK